MNVLEVLKDAFAPFMDGEKKPLHVGEAMNLWFFLAQVEEALRIEQVAYNSTKDHELKEKLGDLIHNVHKPIVKEVKDFLLKESVPLPKVTPEKPLIDHPDQTVPEWARMLDEEIASFVVYKIILGINVAARGLTEAVRADVGMMFLKYIATKVTFSLTFRRLMEEKGWMKIPPNYHG